MARVTLKPAEIDLVGLRKFLKRQTQHGIVQHTESAVEMVICTQKDVFSHSHIFNQIPRSEYQGRKCGVDFPAARHKTAESYRFL